MPRFAFPMIALVVALAASHPASAQAKAESSGPLQQLRIYTLLDATSAAFHERFRDHAMRIMKRHGFDIVAMWETRFKDKPELVYVLNWPDEPTMKAAWAAFMADEEWAQIKRVTGAKHGRMVDNIDERVLRLTPYSPPLKR